MKVSAHILVKGHVQRVGFRWFVEKEAVLLNLTGFVRNLNSGDVEAQVEGERGLIEELIKKIKIGNRLSQVNDVRIDWGQFENKFDSFMIRV
ncbi:hypothetical protein B6I21_01220 [candidate division KSB1 bacterium 4572_119]|nr:MAG: hypothetical protein B6I21_01220 [candidate division KSB1 bacterium 4572_119]